MSALENVYGYPAPVWRHFAGAAHAGRLAAGEPSLRVQAGSRAAQALIELEVRVVDGRIAAARFLAYGCPVTLAVGDWLAGEAEGRDLRAFVSLTAADIRAALEIPDDKTHCALMGEDAIRALAQLLKFDPAE